MSALDPFRPNREAMDETARFMAWAREAGQELLPWIKLAIGSGSALAAWWIAMGLLVVFK